MAAIIVVCVGFLLFMIILGVVRIRAAHRRTQVVHVEEKQEMEWDNSALNITVNPVEQEVGHWERSHAHSVLAKSNNNQRLAHEVMDTSTNYGRHKMAHSLV